MYHFSAAGASSRPTTKQNDKLKFERMAKNRRWENPAPVLLLD
jgi:hypothetical protein